MTFENIKAHLDERIKDFTPTSDQKTIRLRYLPHPYKVPEEGQMLLTLFPRDYFKNKRYHHVRLSQFHNDTFRSHVLTNLEEHILTRPSEGKNGDSSLILYKTESLDDKTLIPSFIRTFRDGLIEILFPTSFSSFEEIKPDQGFDFTSSRLDINEFQTKTEGFFKAMVSILKGLGYYDGKHILGGILFGFKRGRIEPDSDPVISDTGYGTHSVSSIRFPLHLEPSEVSHLEHDFEGGRHFFERLWRLFKYESTLKKHSDGNWYRW